MVDKINSSSSNIILNLDIIKKKFQMKMKRCEVMSFYNLLLMLKQSFRIYELPNYLIFFLNIRHNHSDKEICSNEMYQDLMLHFTSDLVLEINLRDDFILLDNDSSIIEILERLYDEFESILNCLIFWDLRCNFFKKQNLYLTTKNMVNTYKSTYAIINQEKIRFLKNEYSYTSFPVNHCLS